jgi:DNA recombination-dependent growth factor C
MGIFKGAMTLRRYHAEGEVPEDFRAVFASSLNDHAFLEPRNPEPGQETVGWCQIHNLLDTNFDDSSRWLYNHYLTAGLRIDKKVLPSKLFKAHLDKKIQEWCAEHGREKAPSAVRREQKELLEIQMLARTLPRVAVHEFCWNIVDGWVLFHNTSDGPNDHFLKLFRTTFGVTLTPLSPLDLISDDEDMVQGLELAGISDYRPTIAGAER